jgi:hypothetical protein
VLFKNVLEEASVVYLLESIKKSSKGVVGFSSVRCSTAVLSLFLILVFDSAVGALLHAVQSGEQKNRLLEPVSTVVVAIEPVALHPLTVEVVHAVEVTVATEKLVVHPGKNNVESETVSVH